MSDPNIGRVLSNRYLLEELIGQGAMGRVYGAKDILLGGVPVAVKFLAQTLLTQKMRDRFEQEAMTCALLGEKSDHIVNVKDYGVDDDEIPYYVMEYLRGESLSTIINQQSILLPRFLELTMQICLGLQCAHEGIPINGKTYPIVHRDIKPSNILVIQKNFEERVKILDFGIAKILQEDSDQTNCFMGTLAYSSPEQMEGRELDARSDIYSLGIIMFQMLTGKMPLYADTHTFGGWYKAHHHQPPRSFEEVKPGEKPPKVLESLVMRCLAKSPGDRPQSIREVLTSILPLRNRLSSNIGVIEKIEKIRSKPITPLPSRPTTLSPEDFCRLAVWPIDKPRADIVFPSTLRMTKEVLATVWVMLDREEIEKRVRCTRYNQFLFIPSPHPALLWLTVLFNREHGPRWLSCYLDLKTFDGQQLIRALGEAGQYYVLFFAKQDPNRCANVQTSTIAKAQCKRLQQWATTAYTAPNTNCFNLSKSQLKAELDNLKPKIVMQLESIYDPYDLSNSSRN